MNALGEERKMKRKLLPLNLQHFADPEPPADPPADPPATPTFDDILKDKEHQAEFDRRVTKALETARAKWQADTDTMIEQAKTEAEKLAKMTLEQKAQHEREKREAELADREAALTLRELKAQAASTLTEKGLPLELLESINYTDADTCSKSIKGVEKAFRAAVQVGVEERMKGTPPKTGHPTTEAAQIKAAFGND